MSQTKSKKGSVVAENLKYCRDSFDYIVKMSMEKIKKGGRIDSEFMAIVFLENEPDFTIIPVPLGDTIDAQQRKDVIEETGKDLAEKNAKAMVFITLAEAWVSSQKLSSRI